MCGVTIWRDGKLADMTKRVSLRVDHGRPEQGGDARPLLIGMLCHRPAGAPDTLYLLFRMLDQLTAGMGGRNRCAYLGVPKRRAAAKSSAPHLDFREFHKHTAITDVIRDRFWIVSRSDDRNEL